MRLYFAREEIVQWLAQNITGRFDYRKNIGDRDASNLFARPTMEPVYCFENENDAVAFKLRWVGAPE
ncbi:MAG: hypothetical protein EOO77_41100 [Oxalobacteraceae bacterium]|nr:MAG: hypothetical protein EOO77_41100 [Oxalobacteraceae bacterium]